MDRSDSTTTRPRRSVLYMPASNAKAIAKARTLPCDVVVFDLEDAVAPDVKAQARDAAVAAVRDGGFGAREVVVRVNALATPWGEADVAALRDVPVSAVLVPKVDGASDIAACVDRLPGTPVWVMIETTRAVMRLEDVAASPGLSALVMGTNDLAKEMRARLTADRLPFLGFLANAIAAGRAYGLAVLDGVYNAIEDGEGLARECRQARDFGFDGKTLIHPSQIDACNAAFTPTDDEIAWARTIVAAFAEPGNAGKGAIRVDGRMVELLHLEQARATLSIMDAIRDRA